MIRQRLLSEGWLSELLEQLLLVQAPRFVVSPRENTKLCKVANNEAKNHMAKIIENSNHLRGRKYRKSTCEAKRWTHKWSSCIDAKDAYGKKKRQKNQVGDAKAGVRKIKNG